MNLSYTIYCAIQGCKDKKRLKMIASNKKHYQEKVAELKERKNDKIEQDPIEVKIRQRIGTGKVNVKATLLEIEDKGLDQWEEDSDSVEPVDLN